MRFIVLNLLLLDALFGCGGAELGDNHGYGWQYDAQGAGGLKLRYSPALHEGMTIAGQPVGVFEDPAFYENGFSQVQACTGMSAPAPFIIIVPSGTLGVRSDGVEYTGFYYSNPSLILINDHIFSYRHEMIHYLLDFTTGDLDPNHTSPLFEGLCS